MNGLIRLKPRVRSLKLLVLLPVFSIASASAQAATQPCRLPDFAQQVQCGKLDLALDPAHPEGKKITVNYVVVPSQDKNKLKDAVFLLAGGPGQSAIDVAGFGQNVLSRLNRRRDLVFVDQRGTGKSAPLNCPELEKNESMQDSAGMLALSQSCLKKLQALPYGQLQYFSTSIAVKDLEAVRIAQGYSSINLVGASYGTRVGLEYLRQFPNSVRRMVLDGVTPPEMQLPAGDVQIALDGVFADCLKTPACNSAYPDLSGRWKKLLAHMPQQISILHPRLGHTLSFTMTHDSLLGVVQKILYRPSMTATLPYALTQAEQGRFAPLLTQSGAFDLSGPGAINFGMHFSVWCGESFARPVSEKDIPQDEFSQMSFKMYSQVCEKWPRASIPAEFFKVGKSNSPVLLLTGGIDPVTPKRHAASVAKSLGAKALHLNIDNAGHGLLTHACIPDLVYRYINAREEQEALQIDSSCLRQIPRPAAWYAPELAVIKAGEKP